MNWWNSLAAVSRVKMVLVWTGGALGILLIVSQQRVETLKDRDEAERKRRQDQQKLEQNRRETNMQATINALQQQQAPRSLTTADIERIKAALSAAPKGPIQVGAISGDEEATRLARQFFDVLTASGYQTSGLMAWGIGSPSGVWLQVANITNPPPHAKPLFDALRQLKMKVEASSGRVPPDVVSLSVGSKPVP